MALEDIVSNLCFPVLQVDLLKSTSLPLMKRFGVDGEAFVLKVECVSRAVVSFQEKMILVD